MPCFTHRERVVFADLDALRHVNNAVFLRWFETARISYLRGTGTHDPVQEGGRGFGFIFAECHIKYRSPVLFDEQVDIGLAISHIHRSSFRIDFEMRVDDRLCAEGYGVMVGYDYSAKKPAQLPDEIRRVLEAEIGAVSAPASP